MSVEVKNYRWHPVWHDERSQDESYRMLPLDHKGALAEMERLAGLTNNNGSLSLYSDKRRRMKDDELIEHLAAQPDMTKQRARKILNRLVKDKYIKLMPKSGIVVLTYWKRWQVKGKDGTPPSEDAGRQRASRERRRKDLMHRAKAHIDANVSQHVSRRVTEVLVSEFLGKTLRAGQNLVGEMIDCGVLVFDGSGNVCSGARPAAASSAPPSDSDSVSGCEHVTQERDMSHIEKNEKKKDTSVSSNSVSNGEPPVAAAPAGTSSPSVFGGGGRSGRRSNGGDVDPRSIWDPAQRVFLGDPRALIEQRWCVEAAQMITADFKPYARNSWDKWVRDWPGIPGSGAMVFQECLRDLVELMYDGQEAACKCPAAYLNGILKKRIREFGNG